MGFVAELRASSRLGVLVGVAAASVGVIYGYDLSNIAGALLFITDEFGLTTRQQELLTTAVVIGEIAGAIGGGVLANRIGRKKSMVLVAATYGAFAVLAACSTALPMLMARDSRWASRSVFPWSWCRCSSRSPRRPGCAARCWWRTRSPR